LLASLPLEHLIHLDFVNVLQLNLEGIVVEAEGKLLNK
jgi:hypothetical protein